jgi:glycosyltransferase involved in cell wall biosynthesis
MRLIFVTQVLDAADPVLGVGADLARALAPRCDRLAIIANEVRAIPPDLPAEVVSLGKENRAARALRGLRYESALLRLARRMPADALLAHMCPIYLNLAAPIAKPLGIRTVLWYAHPARTPALRLAERLADVVITSLPGAYPQRTRIATAIGQAVDLEAFAYSEPRKPAGPLRLLALGRMSASKGYPVAIRGMKRARELGAEVSLRIVGPATTGAERHHRNELRRLIDHLALRDVIALENGVPRSEARNLLEWCDALVSTTIPGSGDKVVFEAMAAGRPVLVSNPAFASMLSNLPLSLPFADGSSEEMADRIVELAATPPAVRAEIGRELRHRVEEGHSVDHWADSVLDAVTNSLRRKRQGKLPARGRFQR